jgi:hypothetical protein
MDWELRKAKLLILLVLGIFSPLLSGCDLGYLFSLGISWATQKGIVQGDQVNYDNLGKELSNDAIDEELGRGEAAALHASQIKDAIDEADRLTIDAVTEENIDKINQAIFLRPDDWEYQVKKMGIAAKIEDTASFDAALSDGEDNVKLAIRNGADCNTTYLRYYLELRRQAKNSLESDPNNLLLKIALDDAESGIEANRPGGGGPCQ